MSERSFEIPSNADTIVSAPIAVSPRDCDVCGIAIPMERLEMLPHTTTCVHHSDEQTSVVFEVYDHKTAPRLAIIDPRNREALRRAVRAYRRAR